MTYEEKIKDLDELAELLNAIDILTKYHIFFSDVMRHRDDMIEKDKIFLNESLNYIKPKIKRWTIIAFLILSVLLAIIILYVNDFSVSIYNEGNLCEDGSPFYDGRGNYCANGSPFYDSKGNYCDGNSPFYDGQGNLINPGE